MSKGPSKNGSQPKGFVIGRAQFAKISAVEGIKLGRASQRMFTEFDRRGLSAEERRRAIIEKHAKQA